MKSYSRINAVKKTVDIITHLADQRKPVSGADVSEALNIQYGTAMCHLVTLEDVGIVRQIGEHWELGERMALLWARKKSQLQAQRDRIGNTLAELG